MSEQAKYKSEIEEARREDGVVCRTHVGGQALLEGIMMRGKYNWAVAVRTPEGDIHVEEHELISGRKKNSWMYWPIIRGCTALVESLALSFKALDIAAKNAIDFDEDEDVEDEEDGADATEKTIGALNFYPTDRPRNDVVVQTDTKKVAENTSKADDEQESKGLGAMMVVSMILGVLLAIGIFVVVPVVLTNLVVGEYENNIILWNVVDGIIRVAVFIIYIWAIGRLKEAKRMFSYHGAEHKTIHAYEHGCDLTVENARKFPRLHVRCGTAFMIMTLIIAIIVFTIIPLKEIFVGLNITIPILQTLILVITRIIFVPLIAGLSYEVTVKWAGSRPNNPLVRIILWPGMQMQRLTTNQPDDDMLEVAIAAMKAVLEREEKETAKANA